MPFISSPLSLNSSSIPRVAVTDDNNHSDEEHDSDVHSLSTHADDLSEHLSSGSPSTSNRNQKHSLDHFEDDQQLATVTVIEEFDPNSLLLNHPTSSIDSPSRLSLGGSQAHGPKSSSQHSNSIPPPNSRQPSFNRRPKRDRDAEAPQDVHPTLASEKNPLRKLNKKKIAYESKAQRKTQRKKQRTRKLEKAQRAGGKSSRRSAVLARKKGKR